MKLRVQLSREFAAAGLCAAGWFSLWLFAFRPTVPQPPDKPAYPEVTRLVTDNETLRKLAAPTLFALPSEEGFSGRFMEDPISAERLPKKTSGPARYLPRENPPPPQLDKVGLIHETRRLPQGELPIPGTVQPRPAVPEAAETQLFLSPELNRRAVAFSALEGSAAGLPETLRVDLVVNPDGTVRHVFFETPVTNNALLTAIRTLSFKPAADSAEGWIEIRPGQQKEKN